MAEQTPKKWGWNDNPVRVTGAATTFVGLCGGFALAVGADPAITAACVSLAEGALGLVMAVVVREKVTPV